MRIGIDARPLSLPKTGIGRYTSEILKRIVDTDHQFFLYSHTPLPTDAYPANLTLRSGTVRSGPVGSLFAQWAYPRWIARDALDVFWSPRHHLPVLTSIPTVVTIHDLVWRKAPESMIRLGRTLERILMPRSIRKARAIIAVSESTRRDLVELVPDAENKSQTVLEASFEPLNRNPPSHQTKKILFVGTFEPRKNIPGVLQAFANLVAAGNQTHTLVLAGNPGWKTDIPRLARQLGLTDRVEIKRPQSQADLEALYQDCEFLVQPSFYEGFCLPILEAMAFGKPVITSNVSSMPEVGGNAALLVNPQSTTEIAAAMSSLISNASLYDSLSRNAISQAAKFSWERAAAETLQIIESAARTSRTRRGPVRAGRSSTEIQPATYRADCSRRSNRYQS